MSLNIVFKKNSPALNLKNQQNSTVQSDTSNISQRSMLPLIQHQTISFQKEEKDKVVATFQQQNKMTSSPTKEVIIYRQPVAENVLCLNPPCQPIDKGFIIKPQAIEPSTYEHVQQQHHWNQTNTFSPELVFDRGSSSLEVNSRRYIKSLLVNEKLYDVIGAFLEFISGLFFNIPNLVLMPLGSFSHRQLRTDNPTADVMMSGSFTYSQIGCTLQAEAGKITKVSSINMISQQHIRITLVAGSPLFVNLLLMIHSPTQFYNLKMMHQVYIQQFDTIAAFDQSMALCKYWRLKADLKPILPSELMEILIACLTHQFKLAIKPMILLEQLVYILSRGVLSALKTNKQFDLPMIVRLARVHMAMLEGMNENDLNLVQSVSRHWAKGDLLRLFDMTNQHRQ